MRPLSSTGDEREPHFRRIPHVRDTHKAETSCPKSLNYCRCWFTQHTRKRYGSSVVLQHMHMFIVLKSAEEHILANAVSKRCRRSKCVFLYINYTSKWTNKNILFLLNARSLIFVKMLIINVEYHKF